MKCKQYNVSQKRRASTLMALGSSEMEASEKLLNAELYRETVVHLYFTCFYVSQALLCDVLASHPSHRSLNAQLHKVYGRSSEFPRRYVALHTALYEQRTQFDYRTSHTPDPEILHKQFSKLQAYVKFAMTVVPRVEVFDLLRGVVEDNKGKVKDFSFDVYCPKTYSHHIRLTFWQPPFYLAIFGVNKISSQAQRMFQQLRVRNHKNYVVGLNSKVNQYQDDHLIMVDIDTVNPAVEAALKPIGGILFKSGRGFHFIGKKIVTGARGWRKQMRRLLRDKRLKKHVDKNHIGISLRRGYSTLRVTASPVKPIVPFFYKEI